MPDFPEKKIIQKIIPWLFSQKTENSISFINITELKGQVGLTGDEYNNIFHWFFDMKIWKPSGSENLELTDFVVEFHRRFGVESSRLDFHLLHQFANDRRNQEFLTTILPVISATALKNKENPVVTLKALLTFGDKTSEGQLVQAVGTPWFKILSLIEKDPESIYQIDPFKWEEIIAGAYEEAGCDEVILTPRSGDKGRDIIAIFKGIGSIRIIDQVKAYKPGHVVTANDVRALAGVLSMEQNVSKGFVTTTSDFAPRLREDEFIKKLMPYRLELRGRDDLLLWLKQIVSQPHKY